MGKVQANEIWAVAALNPNPEIAFCLKIRPHGRRVAILLYCSTMELEIVILLAARTLTLKKCIEGEIYF